MTFTIVDPEKDLSDAIRHIRNFVNTSFSHYVGNEKLSNRLEKTLIDWFDENTSAPSYSPEKDTSGQFNESQLFHELRLDLDLSNHQADSVNHQIALMIQKIVDRIDIVNEKQEDDIQKINDDVYKRIAESEENINNLMRTSSSHSAQLIEIDSDLSKLETNPIFRPAKAQLVDRFEDEEEEHLQFMLKHVLTKYENLYNYPKDLWVSKCLFTPKEQALVDYMRLNYPPDC